MRKSVFKSYSMVIEMDLIRNCSIGGLLPEEVEGWKEEKEVEDHPELQSWMIWNYTFLIFIFLFLLLLFVFNN